ncbi:peptidase inhibitor family I36 protein [Kribbella sp. NBC_01505]|uniref:peptidase inhibitor family I36 protein n=1 Tax=Kribbella sp. NBC_01505 TaxID=2903580 RepID=UPI0038638B9C
MNPYKKSLIAVLGAVATVLAVSAPASAAPIEKKPTTMEMVQVAAQTGQAWDEQKQELVAAWSCASGDICFYSGLSGTGAICHWSGNDTNWLAAPGVCSWADDVKPKSVRNNGTNTSLTGVRYYSQTGYRNTAGCTPRGARGNFVSPELLRSHQWVNGPCA